MTIEYIKKLLIDTVGDNVYKELKKDHLAILDECAENIVNGSCKIDDRIVSTDQEILISLMYQFQTANAGLQGLLKGLSELHPECETVTVNYRGQTFVYPTKC
jgi:hypothetical protein